MITDFQIRVSPEIAYEIDRIKNFIISNEKIKKEQIKAIQIIKRSVDARQKNIFINLKVRVYIDECPSNESLIVPIDYKKLNTHKQVVVVGAGPAGLFAALRLIELGIRPIIVERGKDVNERRKDIAKISREGIVDEDSNYCFGEGGAGAYSDGKLYTRSKKRGSVERILNILCQHGASEDILIDAHPHIGTDKLPKIIENIRNTIIGCGGEVHFRKKVTDLILNDNEIKGVICEDGEELLGSVILATGHSAREIYTLLDKKNIEIEPKAIAVGVRLEHPQQLIDCIQYHNAKGRGQYLPAAEYSFVTQVEERGVYSFCMCPGGIIVPAASAPGQLVVNGMSSSNRGSKWSNAGMVVEVRPEDLTQYDEYGKLKVMKFQEDMETDCFKAAGNTQKAGAQRMKDFVEGKPSVTLPSTSYAPGIQPSRLDKWMPDFVSRRLKKGFEIFGQSARGFLTNDAILIGVETRTSSPVRIPRNMDTMDHINIKGLYPCGEGAGYAGGIVSAAIDGEKCAEAIANETAGNRQNG